MPRNREFDPQEVLVKAMALFWQKGYAETSMRDLVAHTGVAHAGLYAAFGGKRQLYAAALDHYRDRTMHRFLHHLEQPDSGRAEVEQFFEMVLYIIDAGDFDNGCLMVNTAIEFGDHSGDMLPAVTAHMDRLVSAFQGALTRARQRGEVSEEMDVLATAEHLVTVFNGITVFARSKASFDRIERSVRVALKTLR